MGETRRTGPRLPAGARLGSVSPSDIQEGHNLVTDDEKASIPTPDQKAVLDSLNPTPENPLVTDETKPLLISDFRFRMDSGIEGWYVGGNPSSMLGVLSSTGFPLDTLIAIPFVSPIGGHLDKIGFHVNSAGSPGDVAKCAIYDSISQKNPYPNNLLVAGAEQDCSVTGPMKADIDLDVEPGKLYWLVFWANSGSMDIAFVPDPYLGGFLMLGSDLQSALTHIDFSLTYGEFLPTFPAGSTGSTASMPIVAVRYSS